ncbi:methyltransferase domain-containing protein [Shewanella loihica]
MCSELAKDVPTNMSIKMPSLTPSSLSSLIPSSVPSEVQNVQGKDCMKEAIGADKIARQFSQAAKHYQEHDKVQRLSAQRLRTKMTPIGRLLDIGCGPGTDFSAAPGLNEVLGLDIAPGMLSQMLESFPSYKALCGDAQALPLSDASIDTLYSNLALQWCSDIKTAIGELARVLKPGSQCHLAIVVDGSLSELDALGLRVNAFEQAQTLLDGFSDSHWQIEHHSVEPLRVHFDDLKTLLYSIKGVGASAAMGSDVSQGSDVTQDSDASHGPDDTQGSVSKPPPRLRGRQDWLALCERAEKMRQPEGLPLTYQILFIHASRRG